MVSVDSTLYEDTSTFGNSSAGFVSTENGKESRVRGVVAVRGDILSCVCFNVDRDRISNTGYEANVLYLGRYLFDSNRTLLF